MVRISLAVVSCLITVTIPKSEIMHIHSRYFGSERRIIRLKLEPRCSLSPRNQGRMWSHFWCGPVLWARRLRVRDGFHAVGTQETAHVVPKSDPDLPEAGRRPVSAMGTLHGPPSDRLRTQSDWVSGTGADRVLYTGCRCALSLWPCLDSSPSPSEDTVAPQAHGGRSQGPLCARPNPSAAGPKPWLSDPPQAGGSHPLGSRLHLLLTSQLAPVPLPPSKRRGFS